MISVMVILSVVVSWLILKPFILDEKFPATSYSSKLEINDDLNLDFTMNKLTLKEYEALNKSEQS